MQLSPPVYYIPPAPLPPSASSLYAQALHADRFRAHVAHGREESGVIALLRRKIHELSQPIAGADGYDPGKLAAANALQQCVDKLLIVPNDQQSWATIKDFWSGEQSGIRPGVLSAILASMLQVRSENDPGAMSAAAAASPTEAESTPASSTSSSHRTADLFVPNYVRRRSHMQTLGDQIGVAGGGGSHAPRSLARAGTYHAYKGEGPTTLFGQCMVLYRGEQGEHGVIALLKTRFGELCSRLTAEERAQAQEIQATIERLQADPDSPAAWHTLSSAAFASPHSGVSPTVFSLQMAQPPPADATAGGSTDGENGSTSEGNGNGTGNGSHTGGAKPLYVAQHYNGQREGQ